MSDMSRFKLVFVQGPIHLVLASQLTPSRTV